ARSALCRALSFHLRQAFTQNLDLGANHAAVELELGFARPAHSNTALLAFKVFPHTRQAGREVLQLRELDLQLAFMALRPQGKDVKDQSDTINNPSSKNAFQVALLRWRQCMIEKNDVGLRLFDQQRDFVDLPRPDKQCGIRT